MIRLEYDVTPADYEAFNLHIFERPRLRAQRRRQTILAALCFPLGFAGAVLWLQPKPPPDLARFLAEQLFFGLVVVAAIILLSQLLSRWQVRRMVRTMLGRNPRDGFLGPQRLAAGPEGVSIDNALLTATYRWPGVVGAEEARDHLFVMLGEVYGIIVPKRGQDPAALAALRDLVAASAPAPQQQDAGG